MVTVLVLNLIKNTPIGIHFNSINHNASHFTVMPIEKLKSNNLADRRNREFYWQFELNTIFPKGLNNFPVVDRELFNNLEICSFIDLQVFWSLTSLSNDHDND